MMVRAVISGLVLPIRLHKGGSVTLLQALRRLAGLFFIPRQAGFSGLSGFFLAFRPCGAHGEA